MKKKMVIAVGILVLITCICTWGGYRLRRVRLLEPAARIVTVILPRADPFERARQRWVGRALDLLLRRLDSLRTSAGGRLIYDSLMTMRPGLTDSLRAVIPYPGFIKNLK